MCHRPGVNILTVKGARQRKCIESGARYEGGARRCPLCEQIAGIMTDLLDGQHLVDRRRYAPMNSDVRFWLIADSFGATKLPLDRIPPRQGSVRVFNPIPYL